MTRRRTTHNAWRLNAWASGVLLAGVLVAGNRLAREHLDVRRDLTADQLSVPSPVGKRLLGELSDVLSVKAYFTGEAKLGPVQIAKRQLIEQLEEYEAAANGRMDLVFIDPNGSTEARVEAHGLGIQPFRGSAMQGTAAVTQDTYFGLVLRYHGKEEVLPWVLPQSLEYFFLAAVNKLTRTDDRAVAFLTGNGGIADGDGFTQARALLAAQYRVVEALDLARGSFLPDDVAVLVVARPVELHPRTAFAIDQFVQRGGKVLLLLDHTHVDPAAGVVTPIVTGLEDLLQRWGAPLGERFVWDQGSSNTISTYEAVDVGGEERRLGNKISITYPLWPNVQGGGLEASLPVTAGVGGVDLFWAQEIRRTETVPRHASRQSLLRSTSTSWAVDPGEALVFDPRQLDARAATLLAGGNGREHDLAVSLQGRFPSPFLGGAPAPFDEVAEAVHAEDVAEARAAGREPPPRPLATTDEPVRSEETAGQVVVVGDADWASDGKYFTAERNTVFLVNLVDWLALEDDLIALRSRMPTDRRLDDFLEQERRARGLLLPSLEGEGGDHARFTELETEAADAATRRRWLHMAGATGGSLVLLLLLGFAWRLVAGRPPRVEGGKSR